MPDPSNIRQALYLMRDHARMRLKEYATRHRMRQTGWHFMLDQVSTGGKGGGSGLVLMRCAGERYFCIRVTVEAEGDSVGVLGGDEAQLDILHVDPERVAHLIFTRDTWTETQAIKKQTDDIVKNAEPAPEPDAE
jgi:hypothetical protein